MPKEKEFDVTIYAEEKAIDFLRWAVSSNRLGTSPAAVLNPLTRKQAKQLYLIYLAQYYKKLLS